MTTCWGLWWTLGPAESKELADCSYGTRCVCSRGSSTRRALPASHGAGAHLAMGTSVGEGARSSALAPCPVPPRGFA